MSQRQLPVPLIEPDPAEADRELVDVLLDAYRRRNPLITRAQFRERLLTGIALWHDLDLGEIRTVTEPALTTPESRSDDPICTDALQRLLERLGALTMEDPLTGLFNRRYFDHRLYQELRRARREQRSCGVIMLDVDRFKSINDGLGHEVGDQVLLEVAKTLRGSLRASDEVARFGGDEFAIVLPNTVVKHALMVGERLRANVEKLPERGGLSPTISIGLSCWSSDQPVEADELVRQADTALYEAKRAGRNTVRAHGVVEDDPGGVNANEREALLR